VDPGVVADAVAVAVLSTPGVADLHAGVAGEVATYLPGRRVRGVRVSDGGIDVHVVLEWPADVPGTAAAVRRAVQAAGYGPVHVHVEDIRGPGEHDRPEALTKEGVTR
jgi:uncharacterized alkaline shock family protein YloU